MQPVISVSRSTYIRSQLFCWMGRCMRREEKEVYIRCTQGLIIWADQFHAGFHDRARTEINTPGCFSFFLFFIFLCPIKKEKMLHKVLERMSVGNKRCYNKVIQFSVWYNERNAQQTREDMYEFRRHTFNALSRNSFLFPSQNSLSGSKWQHR